MGLGNPVSTIRHEQQRASNGFRQLDVLISIMAFCTFARKRFVTPRSISGSGEAISLASTRENFGLELHYSTASNEEQIGFRLGGVHNFTIRFVSGVHRTDLGNALP